MDCLDNSVSFFFFFFPPHINSDSVCNINACNINSDCGWLNVLKQQRRITSFNFESDFYFIFLYIYSTTLKPHYKHKHMELFHWAQWSSTATPVSYK